MLLRTRITLFLTVALLFVVGGLLAVGAVSRQIDQARLADIAIDAQASLWRSLLADRARTLDVATAELGARLSVVVPDLEPGPLLRAIEASPDIVTDEVTVQVLDLYGQILASTAPVFRSRPLLGPIAVEALATGERERIEGLRQERPDTYVVAAARALRVRGTPRAVLILFVDADGVLTSLAERLGEESYLVSLRGRMVEGTDPELWSTVAPELPRREAAASLVPAEDRLYFAAGAPVEDLMGGVAGTLVTLRDATETLAAGRRIERTGLLAVGGVGLLLVLGIHLFLRQAFRPLEGAIATLDAISKGRLESAPQYEGASGEIARIGDALTVFRRNAQTLLDQEERIARQRRRQERVIRRQLERLAETLDPEGRGEVLADLGAVMADPAGPTRTEKGPNEDLAVLADVLQRLSQRITDQHRRLNELIEDLRDAIVTRARLAGLEQELEIARELQLSFLPRPLPPDARFAVHGLMETAKEVGGDFFDYFRIDERRVGVVVADVSGKGVAAALFMAITRTLVKATAFGGGSPARTLGDVNDFLAADNDQMMFVTLFHGVLDLGTGVLTYVNAGHNPPLLLHADGGAATALPRSGDPALAVIEGFDFTEMTVTLQPDDMILLFTDGVTEAFDTAGEQFGDERLTRLAATLSDLAVDRVCTAVRDAIVEFEAGAERADDLTCAALRYEGADPS